MGDRSRRVSSWFNGHFKSLITIIATVIALTAATVATYYVGLSKKADAAQVHRLEGQVDANIKAARQRIRSLEDATARQDERYTHIEKSLDEIKAMVRNAHRRDRE